MSTSTADFIIVGGGIGGATLANQLHKLDPAAKITLIEAGKAPDDHPLINTSDPFALLHGEFDFDYYTVPQKHLNGRKMHQAAGKALGGGSVINSGTSSLPASALLAH